MPINGVPEYVASLRYIWRKVSYWRAYWRHNKPRGGSRHCHGIPIFGKNTMSVWVLKCQTTVYHWSTASLLYISQFTVYSTTIPRGGYGYTVYCHGLPLYGKNYRGFSFCLGFTWRIFFLVAAKNPECKNQVKSSWAEPAWYRSSRRHTQKYEYE